MEALSYHSGAKYLGVPQAKLRQWYTQGLIKAFFHTERGAPRFLREDLSEFRKNYREEMININNSRERAGGIDEAINGIKMKIARRYVKHVAETNRNGKTQKSR
jgi:hypothetical protein